MRSSRMNRKGETTPSVNKPDDVWKIYQVGGTSSYVSDTRHPFSRDRDSIACAYGCDETDAVELMNDREFSEHNRSARRAAAARASFLARETSLGDASKVAALLKPTRSQADLNLFLTQNNTWAVGDKVIYDAMKPGDHNINLNSIGMILAVERDIEKVSWATHTDVPCPYLILSFSPWQWQLNNPGKTPDAWNKGFHARWMSLRYQRHLTQTEHIKFFKDNVQLSDYIGQAKDALKAGQLEIQG